MERNTINNLFENLKDEFDIESPSAGHDLRFLNKLNNQKVTSNNKAWTGYWKPFIAIAASVILCVSLFTVTQQPDKEMDLASLSPEMSQTQSFFTATIQQELATLNKERTPETKVLIDDALKQLNILEVEYESLKKDLAESGNDKRVIYAMISNFQSRIDLLQNVLQNIEEVKQLNKNQNENTITI